MFVQHASFLCAENFCKAFALTEVSLKYFQNVFWSSTKCTVSFGWGHLTEANQTGSREIFFSVSPLWLQPIKKGLASWMKGHAISSSMLEVSEDHGCNKWWFCLFIPLSSFEKCILFFHPYAINTWLGGVLSAWISCVVLHGQTAAAGVIWGDLWSDFSAEKVNIFLKNCFLITDFSVILWKHYETNPQAPHCSLELP